MPRMRTAPLVLAALSTLALAGCAGGGLHVRPTGITAAPRPVGCKVEILYYKAPDRPFDELADMETHVTLPPREGAPQVLVPKACELGADAILVRKSQVLNELGHELVVGTAIKFRPEGARAPEPAAAPAAPAPASPPAPTQAPQPAPRADEMPH